MYEFQIGGKGPMDPKARRYTLQMGMVDPFEEPPPAGCVTETTIGSLGLRPKEVFGYWFDFGDDWWHQIFVLSIDDTVPRGRYPKIVRKTGESPPQYPDWDEEDA